MTETVTQSDVNLHSVSQDTRVAVQACRQSLSHGLIVLEYDSPQALEEYLPGWRELAATAADQNAFYAPAFFLPAVQHLSTTASWRLLMVVTEQTREVVGFFPLQETRGLLGMRQCTLWKSNLSYCTTPLVRTGVTSEVLAAVMQHLRRSSAPVHLLHFPMNLAQGRFHQELVNWARQQLVSTYHLDHYLRAEFRSVQNFTEYLESSIDRHHFRELKRQRRRLEDLGQVEFRRLTHPAQAELWTDWFLSLEASGWKGNGGTALVNSREQADFYKALVELGLKDRSLSMQGLFLNGDPISMATTLHQAQGSYAYKIAYNEDYRKYSPGVLLLLHLSESLANNPNMEWLDSCAAPDHSLANRYWSGRRSIENILVSLGGTVPDLTLSLLPVLRTLKRSTKQCTLAIIRKIRPKQST